MSQCRALRESTWKGRHRLQLPIIYGLVSLNKGKSLCSANFCSQPLAEDPQPPAKRGHSCRGLGQDRDMWGSHHGRHHCQQDRVRPPVLLVAPFLSTQTCAPAPMGSLFALFPLTSSLRGRRKGKMSGIQIQCIANLSFQEKNTCGNGLPKLIRQQGALA